MAKELLLFLVAWIHSINIATDITMSDWILANSTLPREDFGMAVGYYNDSIFIIGGMNHMQQLTEFNTNNQAFIDFGTAAFNGSVKGTRQFFTQNGRFLYTIDTEPPHIFGVFDMSTKQYTSSWINTSRIRNSSHYECLASSMNHLFAVGSKQMEMLNLITYQWEHDSPTMNQHKHNFVCLVHENKLLVFEDLAPDYNNTNEAIVITNIEQNTWQYFTTQHYPGQYHTVHYGKAVAHQNKIYLTTGDDFYVYVYDTASDNWTEPLSWPRIFYSALIVLDNILYAFGGDQLVYGDWGMPETKTLNTWMYHQLLTNSSTTTIQSSTAFPTANPSTAAPTTPAPTTAPSVSTDPPSNTIPSAEATESTSIMSSFKTQNVNSQTTIAVIRNSSMSTNDHDAEDDINDNSDNDNLWMIVGIASACVCVTLFIGIAIGICFQRKKQRDLFQSSKKNIHNSVQHKNNNGVLGKDVVDIVAMNQKHDIAVVPGVVVNDGECEDDQEGLQVTQEGETEQVSTANAVVATKGYTKGNV